MFKRKNLMRQFYKKNKAAKQKQQFTTWLEKLALVEATVKDDDALPRTKYF